MRDRKRGLRKEAIRMIIGIMLTMVVVGTVIAQNQTSVELEAELSNLTSDLTSQGYGWLINYSLDNYSKADVGVYVEGGNELIAEIGGVGDEGFYRSYLDGSSGAGLNEGESYKTFDLKIMKGVIKNG